jgi:hypothetical protein
MGPEHKFQQKQWLAKLKDDSFRKAVISIMDDELIYKL